ncbi:uncharacterized protein LOC126374847 [Pectinophora gossypiella]|uniref:uncharacterized protein LOC126374847 n=1 Tax=Pectinophora gossypiella TaxID=13191 RepID=UPI00214E4520|nr:uncharacterized protein LOC126374847 [Pectinophora gossypiella]
MENILENQAILEDGIKKVLINFKKDGASRKTPENIKRRLTTLDLYWEDYISNHGKLKELLPQDHEYFSGRYYENAKSAYLETREFIEKSSVTINPVTVVDKDNNPGDDFQESVSQQGASTSKDNDFVRENKINTGSNSKLDDMIKKQLSNFKAFARTVVNINIENMNEKWEFEDSLNTLQSRWQAIDALHWELDSELQGSNQQYESRFTEHEAKYLAVKKAINTKLWSVSHREKSTPQLDIPVFIGNYQQWVSFKDLFCEAIHNNPSLSNAQKLQYLKSKLRGEPERLIQHLQISSDNYVGAWEILNNRYENKKRIFNSHIGALMNLPVMPQATVQNLKRLHDVTTECLNAIKNIGVNIDTWDPILVYILAQKLDTGSNNDYNDSLKDSKQLPNLKEFLEFLEKRFTSMESARRKQEQRSNTNSTIISDKQEKQYHYKRYFSSNKATSQSSRLNKNIKLKCPVCNMEHGIYYCKQFLEMSPTQKRQIISKLNICCNCLFSHNGKLCTSNRRCRECNGCHNTILHEACKNNTTPTHAESSHRGERASGISHVAQQGNTPETLLSTALVNVTGASGESYTLRALIDQGSQVSLITGHAAQLLRLPRRKCKGIITGVGAKDNTCTGMLTISCNSLTEEFIFNADVYIMKSLTRNLPSGICNVGNMTPVAQQTRLGWILCGKVQTLQCNVVLNNIEELHRFWEIEDIQENTSFSTEESQCVEFYKTTTTRSEDGKYQVRLPLKSNIDQLGQSKHKAIAQFHQLERKFSKNKTLEQEYKLFIHEYQNLYHMRLADGNTKLDYYLPHHCVLREQSTTTSHRVVFNASQTTTSGQSLNDCMCKGPNLQKDLLTLILGWRQYKVAFTADIEKMFRQIWIHKADQGLQKIVWRDSPRDLLREYQLTTVTYGTKAAPFLAMMTLRQLAADEKVHYPEASQVVENCFYMDDLLHGTHSLETALQLKQDLMELMKSGGFHLRKWNSNYQELKQEGDKQGQNNYNFKQAESTKTLGLIWNPDQDIFIFQSKIPNENGENTKRTLLSDISKLFDPLGWLTPLSTKMKLLFQQVWETNMAWDDKLPDHINTEWQEIKQDIENINNIQIPRWLGTDVTCRVELHGFCDASQKAYACSIYSKIVTSNQVKIVLVVGKSRLVPINKEITLPRLELSGALLLSKLMMKVLQALSSLQDIKIYGWIDSTAVLGWLQGNPNRWKPFVSNRVHKITEVMPPDCWRYVKSADNPADCASRGLTATRLQQHSLWWQGPAWLSTYNSRKQEEPTVYTTREDEKQAQQVNVVTQGTASQENLVNELINKYSSYNKVVRVLSWVRRFSTKKQDRQHTTWLTLSEIREATSILVKQVQEQIFHDEIGNLKDKKVISGKSKLLSLNPFLDDHGILRVGGRLQNARISPAMKNPIILPQNHRLTELIINHAHKLTFHGGARVTLALTRQKYWILSGNRTTKKYLHRCVTCKKQKPNKQVQLMADLPGSRVNPSRPFMHTGVDFTGHILLKANKGRGIKTTKGYVAVFVCMVTKAVHLELVSDLTTSAFIAALRRMSARRGTPRHIYCDNGRNFVGTSRVLQQEYQELMQTFSDNDELQKVLTEMEIKFHFNAPSWPSAGGLWEAAVKSFKFHLKRVIGEQRLTYEEYSTLLTQIEACLNSRPLCALSEDPDDLAFLTPSHFLTGGPTLTLVETERDLRTRWQLTQKILQDIWKRWRAEYLSQLTARSKWKRPQENIKLNDVVLVHEDNLPPGKWIMGRVVQLHPGKDGYTRVITLKTKGGFMKRPVIKLSVLTEHDDNQASNLPVQQAYYGKHAEQEGKPQRTSNAKGKKFCLTSILTAFMLFMIVISEVESNVNVTKFRENQSMYFDKVSNMLLIKDEWKLVVYYQMDPYWQGNKALETYVNTMEKACTTIREQAHCKAILLQLRHGYDELEHYNQLLLSQQGEQRVRRRLKRGLINGVGYLANTLFGVLDEKFAEQYQKDIALLRQNQNHIASLWKNQTLIVESENNLLKRTERVMNEQHKLIHRHMNTLENSVQELKNVERTNNVLNDFALGAIIASNVLHNLKGLQDTLLDTITDIYQGRFNLHLLTPEQLINELSTISSKLTKDVTLPVDNIHSDLRKLYSLMKIKARMLQDYLLFEIRIPLVSRETFEILKLVPIPKLQGENIISLIPVSDYIAMNLKKDTFIPMSEIDVRACIVQLEVYYCHSQKPEFHMKIDKNLCEMQKQDCKTTTSTCNNKWLDSYSINMYMYFCCEPCQVRTMCEDQVTTQQLTGAGLISVGHGCIIKTDEFMIYPHKPHTSEIRISPNLYTPTISPINNLINLTIPHLSLPNASYSELEQEASDIGNKIKTLKTSEPVLSDGVTYHDVHHYAMIYVIFGIIALAAIIFLTRRIRSQHGATTASASGLPAAPPAPEPAPTAAARAAGSARRTSSVRRKYDTKSTSPVLRKFNDSFNEHPV